MSKCIILSEEETKGIKLLLKYCLKARDFKMTDKHIDPSAVQTWELCKCNVMFKLHNLMDSVVSKLFEHKGYTRKPNIIGINNISGLNNMHAEVRNSFIDLKTETVNLENAFKISKNKYLADMCCNNFISRNVNLSNKYKKFISKNRNLSKKHKFERISYGNLTQVTPVDLLLFELHDIFEKIIDLDNRFLLPVINNILACEQQPAI